MKVSDSLYTIVYLSNVSNNYSPAEMENLINISRIRNRQSDITGILIFGDGNIIQVLEGSNKEVHETFDRIQHDNRHENLIVLMDNPTEERTFENWSMGFNSVVPQAYQAIEDISTEERIRLTAFSPNQNLIIKLLQDFVRTNT